MAINVDHIADVSFKQYFLGDTGEAPANGKIKVNDNTYEVTFANGQVNARFTSGNWFTNLFRWRTMGRFKDALQTQYNNWVADSAKATAAGFKNNQNITAVKDAVNKCFDIIYEASGKLDENPMNVSQAIVKAYAMPHSHVEIDEDDFHRFQHFCESTPPGIGKYAKRLGQFYELAAVRNELTTAESGTEADLILSDRLGFITHMDKNCEGRSEEFKKRYILNMLDSIIDGFLQAFNAMEDKKTDVFLFLDSVNGACVEAKNDNVLDWLGKASGVTRAARSTDKNDLAFSVLAEFNAIADEVKAPFREAARKSCEAEVRAECQKEGIEDAATINDRITARVETIVLNKSAEIDPLINQRLEKEGKSFLYDNLAGARRPVTEIAKDENTGMWTVTTLVDKNGKPILKPVSAYDIDKYFGMLVDMYKEDAVIMNMIDNKTRKVHDLKMVNRMDLNADDVIRLADKCLKYDEDMASLTTAVKNQLRVELDLADWELNNAIRDALEEVKNLRQVNADDTQNRFARFVKNYVDGSYADQLTDEGRLANLISRRIENVKASRQTRLANLDNKAAHCAQMLKLAYPDKIVDVKKAQEAIAATLRVMIGRAYPEQAVDGTKRSSCKTNLDKLMVNGRLFTDELRYDISHRAPGRDEIDLKDNMKILLGCIEHYGKIDRATFMRKSGEGEVMA